jgi:Holliday junction DNA helicase RuvA
MITFISGPLVESTPLRAVIDLDGLGYEVNVPVTTSERLPGTGQTVKLYTHVVYREDSQTLYGFATTADRDFFKMMIEHVSGVGPKVALSIMSRLSLPLLTQAIQTSDVATLSKCPGIGKKTAERLIIELRSRLGSSKDLPAESPAAATAEINPATDAIAALSVLGYKTAEADKAVRQAVLALGADAPTEQLIKHALGR